MNPTKLVQAALGSSSKDLARVLESIHAHLEIIAREAVHTRMIVEQAAERNNGIGPILPAEIMKAMKADAEAVERPESEEG